MNRGEIWWVDLPEPSRLEPGFKRPLVILQSDIFNKSKINTVICAVITSNLRLAEAPGNVLLTSNPNLLPKDSVINVSQIITIDKSFLLEKVGKLNAKQMERLEKGIRLVLELEE